MYQAAEVTLQRVTTCTHVIILVPRTLYLEILFADAGAASARPSRKDIAIPGVNIQGTGSAVLWLSCPSCAAGRVLGLRMRIQAAFSRLLNPSQPSNSGSRTALSSL